MSVRSPSRKLSELTISVQMPIQTLWLWLLAAFKYSSDASIQLSCITHCKEETGNRYSACKEQQHCLEKNNRLYKNLKMHADISSCDPFLCSLFHCVCPSARTHTQSRADNRQLKITLLELITHCYCKFLSPCANTNQTK